jgi:hypothetical protein
MARTRCCWDSYPRSALRLLHRPSYPAHAGYPVRRGLSIPSLTPRNTGSPAFAGDDSRDCSALVFIKCFAFPRRHAPEFCKEPSALKEGVGNAGCPVHPQPRVRCGSFKMHTSIHSGRTGNHPASPHAMVLRLPSRSPRRSGFLVTVIPEKLASQELDASVEASGPHDFAVRFSAVRQKRCRVHRIRSQRS